MGLSRLAAKCQACAYLDICDHKRMEAVGVLPLPETQVSLTGNEVEINIEQGIDIDAIIKEISRDIWRRINMFNYEEKQTVEITVRPVCECGHVFKELRYNVHNKTFFPASCPNCMRPIVNLTITDFSKLTPNADGDIEFQD